MPALGYDTHDPNFPMGPAETVSLPDISGADAGPARDFVIPASMVPVVDDLVAALVERDCKIAELQRRLDAPASRREPAPDLEVPAAAPGDAAPFILAVGSRKGGIGKTTTAVNLSVEMALRGMRTLLVDLDPQGHAVNGLGVAADGSSVHQLFGPAPPPVVDLVRQSSWPGLSVVGADPDFDGNPAEADPGVLERALRGSGLAGRFDVIILDLPPTLDATVRSGLACADALLVPLLPHPLALDGAARIVQFFRTLHADRRSRPVRVGIAPVMVDTRLGLHRRVLEQAERRFGADGLFRAIRTDVRLAEAFAVGHPIRRHAPRSRGCLDYHLLTNDVIAAWMRSP